MSTLFKKLALCGAACLAFGSTAYAVAGDAPPPPPGAAQWHGHRPDGPWHDLEKIHAQLNLSAAQEQQLQAVIAQAKAAREQERTAMKQSHEQMKALMQAPVLDLRALSTLREQTMSQAHQTHQQVEESWLKFYDSLNTDQKTLVSTTLKAHWQKMEERRQHRADHWKNKKPDGAASQAQ
jgi:periplasmic protein CpxP/Spy